MADLLWVYSASRSHVGRKRKNNEDSVASFEPDDLEEIETKGQLYIVADGVGGAMKGEKASQYAASKVLYDFFQKTHADPGKSLSTSMQQVNADIYNYSHTEAHYGKMATTMVAAAIFHNNLVVANVGDSRAYLIRDGVTKQITRDHNIAAELVRDGVLSAEEAKSSKTKNSLTRSLGGEPHVRIDVFGPVPLKTSDRVVLCTDGLSRYATEKDLIALAGSGEPEVCVNRLIQFANTRGGADNVTASVVVVDRPISEVSPEEIARRASPQEPAFVDNLPTEFPQLDRKIPHRKPVVYVIYGIAGILVLSAAVFLGLWGGKSGLFRIKPTIISNETVTSVATASLTPKPTSTSTPTNTPTITPEVPALLPVDSSPASSIDTDGVYYCLSLVPSQGMISYIVPGWDSLLNLSGEGYLDYTKLDFYRLEISGNEISPLNINLKKLIEDPDKINEGWFLIVPHPFTDSSQCKKYFSNNYYIGPIAPIDFSRSNP